MFFFNNLLWKKYPVDFHKIFRVCLSCHVKDIAVQIFVLPTELFNFNMFKIELENRDFRKSLYFYIVDAEKKAGCV